MLEERGVNIDVMIAGRALAYPPSQKAHHTCLTYNNVTPIPVQEAIEILKRVLDRNLFHLDLQCSGRSRKELRRLQSPPPPLPSVHIYCICFKTENKLLHEQ